MDDFLRLGDAKTRRHTRKPRVVIHREVTAERIERLKKTFQPYWMRGMILHQSGGEESLNGMDGFTDV